MITSEISTDGTALTIRVPIRFQQRGGRKIVQVPHSAVPANSRPAITNPALLKAVVRGWRWARLLETGRFATMQELADAEGVTSSYLARIVRLDLLAPDIVESILDGRQPENLQLEDLRDGVPKLWAEQHVALTASP